MKTQHNHEANPSEQCSAAEEGATSPAPSEFRYWHALERPTVARLRKLTKYLFNFDPAPTHETARAFARDYFQTDPLAAAYCAECRNYGHARQLLDQALQQPNASAPAKANTPALAEILNDLRQSPAWLDWQQLERGARVFRRYGSAMFHFAGAITLSAYAENSVAKPLALTGAYAGDSARRRFLETAAFWIDVSEPGALRQGAAGWQAALRVRLLHAFIRSKLSAHPEWDEVAWGAPISQADSVLTLMGGSFVPGVAMQAMGYRPTKQDIEASMHFWRYVGHLMGVRPSYYPQSLSQAAQLMFMALLKGADAAGKDGQVLCQGYLAAFKANPNAPLHKRLTSHWRDRIHRGYTRFFMPGAQYRQNRMKPAGLWALHPIGQFPLIFLLESLRRRSPWLDSLADQQARASRQRWLDSRRDFAKAQYRPVTKLSR